MNNKIVNKSIYFTLLSLFMLNSAFAADRMSDVWKEATINARFNLNDILETYSLETEVVKGKAIVKGHVSNDVEKDLAGEIAKNVAGITSVDNRIVVDDKVKYTNTSTISQTISDASTTARVKSRFLWSSGVPAMAINVDTSGGVVTLKGNVPLSAQKKLAAKLASDTHGVRRVNNLLNVANDNSVKVGSVDMDKVEENAGDAVESAGNAISDAWIDTKVTASLNFTRSLNIDNLSVRTNSGMVTLSGVAYSDADKELAKEIAVDIKGVKSVTNNIVIQ